MCVPLEGVPTASVTADAVDAVAASFGDVVRNMNASVLAETARGEEMGEMERGAVCLVDRDAASEDTVALGLATEIAVAGVISFDPGTESPAGAEAASAEDLYPCVTFGFAEALVIDTSRTAFTCARATAGILDSAIPWYVGGDVASVGFSPLYCTSETVLWHAKYGEHWQR